MKRGGPIRRKTVLNPQSAKRKVQQAIRRALAGPLHGEPCVLALPVCTGRAEHWHELVPSGRGGSRIDPRNISPSCDACNSLVEDTPTQATARGMKVPTREAMDGEGGLVPIHPNPYSLAHLRGASWR